MGASTRSYPTRRCPPLASPAEVPCSRGERGVQPRPCPSACRVSGRGLGRPPQRCHLFAGTGRIERLAQPSGVGGRRGSAGDDPTSNQRPGLGLGRGGCQHPGRVLIGDQVVPNRGRDPPGTVQIRARGGGKPSKWGPRVCSAGEEMEMESVCLDGRVGAGWFQTERPIESGRERISILFSGSWCRQCLPGSGENSDFPARNWRSPIPIPTTTPVPVRRRRQHRRHISPTTVTSGP